MNSRLSSQRTLSSRLSHVHTVTLSHPRCSERGQPSAAGDQEALFRRSWLEQAVKCLFLQMLFIEKMFMIHDLGAQVQTVDSVIVSVINQNSFFISLKGK